MIVGLYPDATVASCSPWPLILKAYEMSVSYGTVFMKRKASELCHEKVGRELFRSIDGKTFRRFCIVKWSSRL